MGCERIEFFTVNEPEELIIDAAITDVSCYEGADGAIDVNISGGVGGYMIDWSSDANSDLVSGDYMITITDMNNCVEIQSFFVAQPEVLFAELQITEPINGDDGTISGVPTGGTPPYDFSWNDGALEGGNLTGLSGGVYDLILTDGNGCIFEQTVVLQTTSIANIENLQTFEIFPNPNDGEFFLKLEFEKKENIEIQIVNELGQVLQSYRRDGDYFLEKKSLTELSAGVYFVMVKTESGVAVRRLVVQ